MTNQLNDGVNNQNAKSKHFCGFEHVNLHVQTCDFFLCFSWFPGFQGAGSLIQYLTE